VENLSSWVPLALGAIVVIVICYKVFTDPNVSNYIAYAIIAALVLCAMPTLQNISAGGSWGQISADMKATSETVRGAVASQSADVQGQVALLNKKLDSIVTKLNATAEVQEQITPAYRQNSSNQVLIYFAPDTRMKADKIRDFLLNSGYKSSASMTDFTELTPPLPNPGSVRLVYADSGVSLANT